LREDRSVARRLGRGRSSVYSRDEDYGPETIAAGMAELLGSLEAKKSWRLLKYGLSTPYL
jgi:hypothetical protein